MGSAHRVNMGNNWRGQKEGITQGGSRYKLKPTELKDQKLGDSKDEDFGFYRMTKDSVGPKVWWHELDRSEYSSDSEEEEYEANMYKIDIMNKTSCAKNKRITMNKHLKEVHMGNPFKYRWCPKKYKTRSNKKKHENKSCTLLHSPAGAACRAYTPAPEPNYPQYRPRSPEPGEGED